MADNSKCQVLDPVFSEPSRTGRFGAFRTVPAVNRDGSSVKNEMQTRKREREEEREERREGGGDGEDTIGGHRRATGDLRGP